MRKLARQAGGLLSDKLEQLLARLEGAPKHVHVPTGPLATEELALRTILVLLDGSLLAERALAYVYLVVVCVAQPSHYPHQYWPKPPARGRRGVSPGPSARAK